MTIEAVEFRGVDNLVYAKVLTDGADYTTGTVKPLAPVAEISKEIEQGSATKYYDNLPKIVIRSVGSDTITVTLAALDIETLADISGQYSDDATGALSEGEASAQYFALGYRFLKTDGTYRYVWRYKGMFSVPKDGSKTKDAGTDGTNQELTYTGVSTTHAFTKGGAAKALVVDESDGKADLSTFFATVTTIDTLTAVQG
jgi:phi13 family phage major tail protein